MVNIPVRSIQDPPELLRISFPPEPGPGLLDSLHRHGLLAPLHLVPEGEHYQVLIGYRRLQAARALGWEEIPCLIRDRETPFSLFLSALEDNLCSRHLNVIEVARALRALSDVFQIPEANLLREFLPRLGLEANRRVLRHHLRLATLPLPLQRAVLTSLDAEIALQIQAWEEEERRLFLRLHESYRLGRNRQRQLFTLMDELRPSHGSLQTLWRGLDLETIHRRTEMSPQDRLNRIVARLQNARYPNLNQYEKRFQQLRDALRLPPSLHLQKPEFFEGDELTLSCRFRSAEELRYLVRELSQLAEREEWERIFQLL